MLTNGLADGVDTCEVSGDCETAVLLSFENCSLRRYTVCEVAPEKTNSETTYSFRRSIPLNFLRGNEYVCHSDFICSGSFVSEPSSGWSLVFIPILTSSPPDAPFISTKRVSKAEKSLEGRGKSLGFPIVMNTAPQDMSDGYDIFKSFPSFVLRLCLNPTDEES